MIKHPSGKNHWNWKGGKTINSQGYILIYSPKHPLHDKRGYVREHRLVVENNIGRFLSLKEIVHHKDGNKTNNLFSNLEVLQKKRHDKISIEKRLKKEKIHKICIWCNKSFLTFPSQSHIECCSKHCSTKLRWRNGMSAFGR